MAEDTSRVLEKIDGMTQEIVDRVSHVVRVPSINPKYPGVDPAEVLGGESKVSQIFADW